VVAVTNPMYDVAAGTLNTLASRGRSLSISDPWPADFVTGNGYLQVGGVAGGVGAGGGGTLHPDNILVVDGYVSASFVCKRYTWYCSSIRKCVT
jgi:hypothetical protein